MTTKKKTGGDLSSIGTVQNTAVIELLHPATGEILCDDDNNPMWVEIYGQDSAEFKEIEHKITNKNLTRMQRSGRGARSSITAEQITSQEIERVVKVVKDWHIVVNGETPKVGEENVRQVFEEYPWVKEQVEDGLYNRQLFLAKSSTG